MNEDRLARQKEKLTREFGSELIGLLGSDDVVEIMLNPDGKIWIERLGKDMEVLSNSMDEHRALALIGTMASYHETIVDRDNPFLQCEVPLDGSRFQAWIPPISTKPCFCIRRRASSVFSLAEYVDQRVMTAAQAEEIQRAVQSRQNILIVGGTGSGKTTLANAIINEVVIECPDHRVFVIEDTAEIQCNAQNAIVLRTSLAASLLDLIKTTLRGRPDRIIVGEVRAGAEALALLKAWNTGHPGGIATIHANSAESGLSRLEQLIMEVSTSPMTKLVGEAIDLVIAIARSKENGASRKITEVLTITGGENGQYQTSSGELQAYG